MQLIKTCGRFGFFHVFPLCTIANSNIEAFKLIVREKQNKGVAKKNPSLVRKMEKYRKQKK